MRYRWISGEGSDVRTRSAGGEYGNGAVRYTGVSVTLYGKGEAAGMNRSASTGSRGGSVYLGKDILGSVRSASGEYGTLEGRYEYDAFGKPYAGDLESGMNLGYTGKPYDTTTGLYNYGYRDYKPEAARFTTVDPIRDGSNWFAYVNNDPVNWVDPWGLEQLIQMTYTKEDRVLVVEVWDDNKPNRPISTKTYTATNNPQPMQTPDATTIPSGENYYPQSFPNGIWKVESVTHPGNDSFGQTKINTNAGQSVPTYSLVDGVWKQTGTTWDTGYQIHGGGYSRDPQGQNNVNDNTYGCIRMGNDDINVLGDLIDKHLKNNSPVTIVVQDAKPKKEVKNK
jgi:RHS repeat-associated protein